MIRTVWVALHLLVATLIFGSLAVLGALFKARGQSYFWIAQSWARWILWSSGCRVDTEGLKYVALDRPQVIASNHASWFDVVAIAAVMPKRFRFIAKKELARVPLFGQAWQAAGHIAIDRRDTQAAVAALAEAGRLMREDNSVVVIFPEGTRSADGELLPFKKGAFMMAVVTGVEVVPTAVVGSRDALPKGRWRVRKGRITVRFAPPVPAAGYHERNRDELVARVRSEVADMLTRPLPPIGSGDG